MLFISILVLGFAAENLAHYIPFEVEQKITEGFDLSENAEDSEKSHIEVQEYLQNLATRIAQAQELPEGMRIIVHYNASDTVNAFATLGGHVMFFRGLLEQLPNENALAMVMAHEVAHIKHRHPIESLGRSAVITLAISTITGATDNDMLGGILGNTGMLTALSFNRDQEDEADATALYSLNALYGHVGGAKALFEVFEAIDAESSIHIPELFRSHPLTNNRIEKIKQTAAQKVWQSSGNMTALPDRFDDWMEVDND